MENNKPNTPDEAKASDTPTPNGTTGEENRIDYEKMARDNQSAFTKERQDRISAYKKLIALNPKEIEGIEDVGIQKKLLEEEWSVKSIAELKSLYPDYAKGKNDEDLGDDEDDEIAKIKQKMKVMEYNQKSTKIKDEMEAIVAKNKEFVDTIPDFESKFETQMSYISESVAPREKVEMAFRLVVGSDNQTAGAYSAMQ